MSQDQQVIEIIQRGGPAATPVLERLLQEFWPPFKKLATKMRLTDVEAEDAFQEAFIIFEMKIREGVFRGEAGLKTYFYRISQNKAIIEYNIRKKLVVVNGGGTTEPTGEILVSEVNDDFRTQFLKTVWSELGEDCRKRLMFHHVEGFSHAEVGVVLPDKRRTPPRRLANNCEKKFRRLLHEYASSLGRLGLRPSVIKNFLAKTP